MESSGEVNQKTILLVDDEILIAMFEAEMLKHYGYEVLTATGTDEAVEMVRNKSVDLVLMDLDLGKGEADGTEAARTILSFRDVPVVFLSSHTEPEIVEKTEKITSYGYVVKNSGETVLIASLKMAFRLHEAHVRQKEAEEEIKASEKRYRELIETMHEGVWEIDRNAFTTFVNPRMAEILGYKPAEMLEKHFFDFMEPDGREAAEESLKRRRGGEKELHELDFVRKDGRRVTVLLSVTPVHDANGTYAGALAGVMDITKQKIAEGRLRESENKFRSLIEQAAEMLFLHDLEGRIVEVNKAAVNKSGYSKGELLQMTVFDIDPDAHDRNDQIKFWKGRTPKDPPLTIEVRHRRKDGSIYTAEVTLSKVTLSDGDFIFALSRDITERKKAKEKIAYEQNLTELLMDNIPDLIYFKDHERRFVRVSRAFSEILGTSSEKMIGKTDADFFTKEVAEELARDDLKLLEEGLPIVNKEEGKNFIRGVEHRFLATKVPWKDTKGKIIGFFGISKDITELKKVQEELSRTVREKENLVMEMNHRVKNNLLLISSFLQLKAGAAADSSLIASIQQQIETIRIVHEMLYKTDDVTSIGFKDYSDRLLRRIFSAVSPVRVKFENRAKDIALPVRQAVPLGLIMNEIGTNAIKHGFPGVKDPVFSVYFDFLDAEQEYSLTLSNSGRAFPEDITFDRPETLGLRLVSALAEQLNGKVSLKRQPYPVFSIRFPADGRFRRL